MKTIVLSGDVGLELTPGTLRDQLPSDGEDVLIEVYSFGGDVFDGLEMYNILKDYPGKVYAKIGALSASAASIFPLAADSITVHKNSTEMIHNVWSFAIGNTDDMKKESEILAGLDGILADIYADRTGKKKSKILDDMKSETWLFGADAIIEYGFADAIDEESEKEQEVDPDSAKAELSAKVASIKARMRKTGQHDTDIEKAASILPKRKGIKSAIATIKNTKQATVPVGDEDIFITREESMDLSEIEKNPEAMAKIDALAAEKAEAMKPDEAKIRADAIAKDRENQSKLLVAMGFRLSDEQKAVFNAGKDAGAYALTVLEREQAKAPKPNANAIGGVDPAPEPKDEAQAAADADKYATGRVGLDSLYDKEAK